MTIQSTTLLNRHTIVGYLVGIEFTTPLYYSSLGDINLLSIDWISNEIVVSGLSINGSGKTQVEIGLADPDLFWPTQLLTMPRDTIIKVYIVYLVGSNYETQKLFEGIIPQVTFSGEKAPYVTIKATSLTQEKSLTPRVTWESPFDIRRYSEVTINGDTYRLE